MPVIVAILDSPDSKDWCEAGLEDLTMGCRVTLPYACEGPSLMTLSFPEGFCGWKMVSKWAASCSLPLWYFGWGMWRNLDSMVHTGAGWGTHAGREAGCLSHSV